jgi:hypothetical protein
MAVSFTDLIITSAELRQEIGDPSLNPSAENYMPDALLTSLIDRYETIGAQEIDEQVANLTIEDLVKMNLHRQAQLVEITPATNADYPNMYVSDLGTDASTSIPVPVRVHDQTSGNELFKDDDIFNTYRAANGLFTARRYAMDGDVLIKLPANANVLSVALVLKADAEDLLAPAVATRMNDEIVKAARRALADRSKVAASFRIENKIEGP